MKFLHGEDLELQVRLARLQTDVQVYLTACFGFFAAFMVCIIFTAELYFEGVLLENTSIVVLLITSAICVISVAFLSREVQSLRIKMKQIENPFTWERF